MSSPRRVKAEAPPAGGDLWNVPGQEHAVAVLRGAIGRGEVGHAWAFVGPAGVGQEQAARALAAALNCDAFDQRPCGRCSACDRTLRGVHPAYWELERTGTFHRVDDVREVWLTTAFRTITEGRFKLLRIIDADRMNEAAANAFLKALEEPPAHTVWVLDLADPDELPDTILSRCRTVRFTPWQTAQLRAEAVRLGLTDPADLDLAVRACMGSPVALRRLAAPGGLDDLRRNRSILGRLRQEGPGAALVPARELEEVIRRQVAARREDGKTALAALAAGYGDEVPRAVARHVEAISAREERETKTSTLQTALDDLASWLRDCLLMATGGEVSDAIHRDAPEALREDATLGCARLLRATELVASTRDSLELNVQPQLALEALFLELHALGCG
jgi:DNA polymerase-3 subunit delta'